MPKAVIEKGNEEMKKLLVAGLSVLTILSTLLISCQRPSIETAITLVPERADAIARVQIAETLNDKDIADLYACIAALDPYAPQTLRLALDELRDDVGVDLRYLNEVVTFADTSTIEATAPYVGAIVECNIPAKQVFEVLQLLGIKDYEVYTYSGYEIYGLDDDINVAFLSSKSVAVGPRYVVQDIIDVGLGRNRPISGELYDMYEAFGDPLVKGVAKVPLSVSQEMPIEISLDMAACTLDKDGSTMYLQLQLYFASSSLASDSADIIQGLIAAAKYIYPQPEIRNMLNKLDVVTYGSQISVQGEATVDEVKNLISVLKNIL